MSGIVTTSTLVPAEPLRKRVPLRDENGHQLADFMMIIPGLRAKPTAAVEETIRRLDRVMADHRHSVVFVDLNLRLNLLWVSTRAIPGICTTLASAIRTRVPEAVLVASPFGPSGSCTTRPRWPLGRIR